MRVSQAIFTAGAVAYSCGLAQVIAIPASVISAAIWTGAKAVEKAYSAKAFVYQKNMNKNYTANESAKSWAQVADRTYAVWHNCFLLPAIPFIGTLYAVAKMYSQK